MHKNLIAITQSSHDVVIDLRYATHDNFTNVPVYQKDAGCFLHRDAAQKFEQANHYAKQLGLRCKIFDAFRPSEAQFALWSHTPDPTFLADPTKGSPHSRGVAIDLTLIDHNNKELEMGTAFDAFTPLSHHGNTEISAEAQRNRHILMGIMTTAGWDFYRNEWWHYQLFDSRSYELLSDKIAGTNMMEDKHSFLNL